MSDTFKDYTIERKKVQISSLHGKNYCEIEQPPLEKSKYICIRRILVTLPKDHRVKNLIFFAHDDDFNYDDTKTNITHIINQNCYEEAAMKTNPHYDYLITFFKDDNDDAVRPMFKIHEISENS